MNLWVSTLASFPLSYYDLINVLYSSTRGPPSTSNIPEKTVTVRVWCGRLPQTEADQRRDAGTPEEGH